MENAYKLGVIFRNEISKRLVDSPSEEKDASTEEEVKPNRLVQSVRGRGLLNAIVLNSKHKAMRGRSGYDVCRLLKENGLLAKQTHENIIRFAPPLTITEEELKACINIIEKTIVDLESQ